MGRGAVKSNTSGSNNTGYGDNALGNITTGNNNSAFGFQAGFYAGSLASSNVYLGYNSGPSFTTPENNKLYIANAAGTPLIGGDFSTKTVTIDQVLVLTPTTSAPSSPVNGMIAVYGVGAAQHIYCYINGAWIQLDN